MHHPPRRPTVLHSPPRSTTKTPVTRHLAARMARSEEGAVVGCQRGRQSRRARRFGPPSDPPEGVEGTAVGESGGAEGTRPAIGRRNRVETARHRGERRGSEPPTERGSGEETAPPP